jgi:hypothetical protein
MSPTLLHSVLMLLHAVAASAAFHIPFVLVFNAFAAGINLWALMRYRSGTS